ncbi:MAG: hypothetical protein JXX14_14750 [Deltaproteobacteria bacterium]|nr:hypothetical protein [Deltaproteobacteria bacterium]
MLKVKFFMCASALSLLFCVPAFSQNDKLGDADEQIMDEELPPGNNTPDAADSGASPEQQKCVPRPEPAAAPAAEEDLLAENDEKKTDAEATTLPEMSDVLDEEGNPLPYCVEKPYVPVEPPPVISDEIDFSQFGENESSAAVKAAKADYLAVSEALDMPLEGPYKRYQFEIRDRRISFAQYMYDDYRSSRNGGIVLMGIGIPIFGGVTAVGVVLMSRALTDGCLPANDTNNECTAPQRGDTENKRDLGIFLTAFGAAVTVASIAVGAVKIKRNQGPMKSLEPLVVQKAEENKKEEDKKPKEKKKALHLNGFAPVVATAQHAAPGTTLAFSF